MARIRTIKPEFWRDGDMVSIPRDVRLFRIACWNFEDDNGVHKYDPLTLKMTIFPGPLDADITTETIDGYIRELERLGKFLVFEVAGKKYFCDPGLPKHQVIDRPRKSNLPLPPEIQLKSTEISLGREGKGGEKEGKGKEKESCAEPSNGSPPEPKTVMAFITARKGVEWPLTEAKLTEYQDSYPHLDILSICRKARQWCIDNPGKRKTPNGMPAFLGRWLAKEADNPRRDNGSSGIRNGNGAFTPARGTAAASAPKPGIYND